MFSELSGFRILSGFLVVGFLWLIPPSFADEVIPGEPTVEAAPLPEVASTVPSTVPLPSYLFPPYDLSALEKALADKTIDMNTVMSTLPKTFFPQEVTAATFHKLPFKKARIDIFMTDSRLHGLKQEFSIVSIDDRVRAIGLISSGAVSTPTPADRWEVYGVDRNRKSTDKNSAMPYAIMLSKFGQKEYSKIALHGTNGYGYSFFGSRRSNGCIRQFTMKGVRDKVLDPKAKWRERGYHRVVWSLLNPHDLTTADHLASYIYNSWFSETLDEREIIQELRYKTTVWTHNAASLAKIPGWKAALEALFSEDLIKAAIAGDRKTGKPYGFAAFDLTEKRPETFLDHETLLKVYDLEYSNYSTPLYLETEDDPRTQYNRRHIDWLEKPGT